MALGGVEQVRALEIVGANLLDAPERHLAYVRERIAGVLDRKSVV